MRRIIQTQVQYQIYSTKNNENITEDRLEKEIMKKESGKII